MTPEQAQPDDSLRDAILDRLESYCIHKYAVDSEQCPGCEKVADALLPLVADRIAQAKAEADAARKELNDLLGYLDWFNGSTGVRLREQSVRAYTCRALRHLRDPKLLAHDAWIESQRSGAHERSSGDGN